jgi:hypothetical protein
MNNIAKQWRTRVFCSIWRRNIGVKINEKKGEEAKENMASSLRS